MRLEEEKKSAREQQMDLRDRLIARSRQLESLEEFRLNKEQLEGKLEQLETTLENERTEHQEQVWNMSRTLHKK